MIDNMEVNFVENFDKSLKIYENNLVSKVLKKPYRYIFTKAANIFLNRFNKTLKLKAKTFWNEYFYVVLPDFYSTIIYRHGFVEEYLITYMFRYLKDGSTFIDAGAHFGFFSALASKLVGAKGRVHSFEPTKHTFKVLELNMKSRENVTINNVALWNSAGKIRFRDFGVANSALNTIKEARVNDENKNFFEKESYEINTISLDKYCEDNHIKPDFVKIDAENSEMEILKGMDSVIQKYSPVIVMEVGDFKAENFSQSRNLLNYLQEKGYKPFEYDKGNIIDHIPKDSYEYNLLLFKK
jgi:FkbM family methyltransferase